MATPAAVEPRTSCPACGGPIHPIAGRCKHCKADLTRLRGGAAPAAKASPAARPNLVALGGGNGHGTNGASVQSSAVATSAVMVPPPAEAALAPRAGWSSRWPLVVALVAVIAIVASVALLLFGGGDSKKDRGVRRNDGPAPELTPTDPLAPQVTPPAPPPNGGQPHAGGIRPDPRQPDPAPPVPTPPPPSPTSGPRTVNEFFTAAIDTACKRLATCSSDDQIATYCTIARQSLPQYGQTLDQLCPDYNSAAAAECLDSVSRFPCPSDGTVDPMAMSETLMGLSGCQRVCPSAYTGLGGGGLGGTASMIN